MINQSAQQNIVNNEDEDVIHKYCTFIYLLHGRKLKSSNVFLTLLSDKKLKDLFKLLIGVDTDFDACKIFASFEPSIDRSKFVSSFVNRYRKENHDSINAPKGHL
tara:strand:+ start:42275 stop:42589 length:315 start_codon:yes stop_codon:yes gene_type:complete